MANMFPKWYEIDGIKCQGKLELAVATLLIEMRIPVQRGKAVQTPHGSYTPDFDCGDFYIEVKGINTWLKAGGVVSFIDNAIDHKLAEISDNSLCKMEWTNDNIKPVIVLVDTSMMRKAYRDKSVRGHNLQVVFGSNNDFEIELRKKCDVN